MPDVGTLAGGLDGPGARPDRSSARRSAGPWLGLAGGLLCLGAVTMVAAGAPRNAAFGRALLELLIVAVPVVAGLYALRVGTSARFGIALIGIGFAWSLTSLAESSASIPYTIGWLSTWLIFPSVVYLLLAFPSGHVAPGLDRALFVFVLAIMVVLFYGTAPLVRAYPPKTVWTTCTTHCPANAVFFVHGHGGFVTDVVYVRERLVMLLWLGLFWSMLRRWRQTSPLQQRAFAPVFAAGVVLGLIHVSFIAYRELNGRTDLVVALSSAWTFSIVVFCAAILFGLSWRRRVLSRTLAHLGPALRETNAPAAVRDALAVALRDPSLELLFRDPETGAWHDSDGWSRSWPRPIADERAATAISATDGEADVVLVHDRVLRDDAELLDGVSGIVLAVWRHERAAAKLTEATRELDRSQRRIAEAADQARARIRRDLHDGAQQRLLAVRVKLARAAKRAETDSSLTTAEIDELARDVEQAIDELRSLGRGASPAALAAGGIVAALHELSAASALPMHISETGLKRHGSDVESAIYFTCVEAAQNAIKHATGATGIWIHLRESSDTLDFEIGDDGVGIPRATSPGQGMRNMRDRIESLGGRLTVESHHDRGTRLSGSIPLGQARP